MQTRLTRRKSVRGLLKIQANACRARYDVQILTIPAPVRGSSGTGLRDYWVKLPWMSQYDITVQQVCEQTRQDNAVQLTQFNVMAASRTNSLKLNP